MSSRRLQLLTEQIKEITGLDNGVIDLTGEIIACTVESEVDSVSPVVQQILDSKKRVHTFDGRNYQKVYVKNKVQCIAFIEDKGEESLKYLSMMALNISNLQEFYEDKHDKSNFIKNVILGNVPSGEILLKAQDLHIDHEVPRVVYLIKTNKSKEIYTYEILKSMFPNRSKDFVLVLDGETTVLVKEIRTSKDHKNILKLGQVIIDTLNAELMEQSHIGIGTTVDNITDLSRSYQEASTALTIGRIFENEKFLHDYRNLGIGRLIYELPRHRCESFLKEVFKGNDFEGFDSETSLTIQKFFENSLNVSETSRQLYIHRNTLVYRLDKIQKMTGLDLRKFDDAIILKISMLVKMYLEKSKN